MHHLPHFFDRARSNLAMGNRGVPVEAVHTEEGAVTNLVISHLGYVERGSARRIFLCANYLHTQTHAEFTAPNQPRRCLQKHTRTHQPGRSEPRQSPKAEDEGSVRS